MPRDIVVIGGSAGALDPLKQIVTDLPVDLPAAVVVVLHLASTARSALAPILNRLGGIHAVQPRNGDTLRPGYIYVAVPDHHLELADGKVHLTRTPRINGVRPAIDVLFRSAAGAYGRRVAGVVLSGGLDDGSAGLAAIRAAGGVGIVQSPDDAMINSMPKNAIETAEPDQVLPAAAIGAAISGVVREEEVGGHILERGGGMAMEPVGALDTPGEITGMTCPDCHGSIWVRNGDGGETEFRCRIGHAYSPESFFELQSGNVENALWAGVRSLEEQGSLAAALASRAVKFGDRQAAVRFEARREVANRNADLLRKLIVERSDA